MSEKKDCACLGLYDEHQSDYECRICSRCIFDEPSIKDKYDTYEVNGVCLDCAVNKLGVTPEELAAIFND